MPTITYNIPQDKQTDVIAALRVHYGAPKVATYDVVLD